MRKKCKHCSARFKETSSLKDYCCHGCEQVSRLIREEGLDHFYNLQNQPGRPLKDTPFSAVDTSWAVDLQQETEASRSSPWLILRVEGMTCLGCVWLVERIVRQSQGVLKVQSSLTNSSLYVSWQSGVFDLAAIAKRLQSYGYRLQSGLLMGFPLSDLARRSLLCWAFGVNVFLLESSAFFLGTEFALHGIFHLMAILFAGLGSFVAAGSFLPQMIRGLRAQVLPQDTLLFAGSLLASIWYLWREINGEGVFNLSLIAGLAFTIVLGRWIQMYAISSFNISEDDRRVDSSLAQLHLWIYRWMIVVSMVLFLSIPVLLVRGFEITSIVEILAGGLLVAPIHFLYEISRYPRSEMAIFFNIVLGLTGLAVVLTGGLSPIGGMMFGVATSLLSIAVLEINQKLGAG
ncbi:MAG: heavy metal translocating P-type ATPase metal-binding domain-containing protein [Verrucomicrobiota bacterium]